MNRKATRIEWTHKVNPNGESFQGWWAVSTTDGQPLNVKPFATKKDAQVFSGTLQSWSDVADFTLMHNLPFKVIRWNMSNRGCLVDGASEFNGDTCADTCAAAADIVLNCAYEMGRIPVPMFPKVTQ